MEWKDKIGSFRQIDVRGIQGNFFQGLKKQVMQLPAGSGLEIVQSFDPIPLYEVIKCFLFFPTLLRRRSKASAAGS